VVLAKVQGRVGCKWAVNIMTQADDQKRGAGAVSRRYSDFVWLLDCLIKRYVGPSSPKRREQQLTPSHSVYSQLYRPRRLVVSSSALSDQVTS
jgi:hypothetical protein